MSTSGVDPETSQVTPPVPPPGAPREPLLTVGLITTVAAAILAMAVSFGLPISDDQQAKLLALILVVAPLIVMAVGRARVWAPSTVRATVNAEIAKAQRTTPPTGGVF